MNEIKAVIFDMDGVIFDTERMIMDCYSAVSQKYGIDDMCKTAYKCIGITAKMTREIFTDRYGEDLDYDKIRGEVNALFRAKSKNGEMKIKEGVFELLGYLAENDIPAAIASSTKTDTVKAELEAAGLLHYFTAVTGGDEVERSKPAPDIFLLAAKKLGKKPDECIVIEDSHNGVRAAYAAGIPAIMVPDMLPPTDEMREKAKILPSLPAVKEYMEKTDALTRKNSLRDT